MLAGRGSQGRLVGIITGRHRGPVQALMLEGRGAAEVGQQVDEPTNQHQTLEGASMTAVLPT